MVRGGLFQVRQTQAAFHPHAQRNVFRRRDARLSAPVSARSLLPESFNPESSTLCPRKKYTHEICSRKDRRSVNLMSDALPFGQWYGEPKLASLNGRLLT